MSFEIGIYTKNSKEAIAFYCNIFDLELGYHVQNADGSFFHAELMKNGAPFLAVAEANAANLPNGMNLLYDNPVELGYTVMSEDEFYRMDSILKDGGKILSEIRSLPWSPLATVIQDKFGVRWYLTLPQHRPEDVAYLE